MSYIALYRKYRPQTFEDIVGQEHITKILKKQIETNKVSHAYIFSGTRGTGKTTAAKVFARAINCLNPKDGEPCNTCEACKSILSGNSTDVVEMDAASNNSVENIRSVRQEVQYATTGLKYKVYIIDEAHMLSSGAFNALLKTLEEPPANVVFILATTEEHKILPTILSRCIRFEFKKISIENIVSRLKKVLEDYRLPYEEAALCEMANLSDGGMRDALSILERCINSSENITVKNLEEIVGVVQRETLEQLIVAILKYNVLDANKVVEKILSSGKDLRNIASNMTEQFLQVLIYIASGKSGELDNILKQAVENVSELRVHEIIKNLSKLDEDLRLSSNASVVFRAKMLELALETKPLEENRLIAEIEKLELRIEKLESSSVQLNTKPAPKKEVAKETAKEEVVLPEKEVRVAEVKVNANELKTLDKVLKKVVEQDNLKLYSALSGVKAYNDQGTVTFTTENAFAFGVLNKDNSREQLKQIVSEIEEKDCTVKIELIKENKKETKSKFEEMMKDTGVPFEIVD